MNRSTPRLLALAAAVALAACSDASSPDTPLAPASLPSLSGGTTDAGGWLVTFSGGVPSGFAQRVSQLGGTVVFAHGGAGLAAVEGLSAAAAAQLGASSGVSAVTADNATLLEPMMGTLNGGAVQGAVAGNGDPTTAWGWSRQWNLRAIGADQAWAHGRTGSPAVRVAILDTGLDYNHPDLAGRVDLAASRSFVASDDALVASWFPGAHPIADIHYHGTHVGATVASNGVVAAGVTSEVTLVGVRVCDVYGSCPVSRVLAGLLYAADQNVDVVNLSVGTIFSRRDRLSEDGPRLVKVINQAFRYADRKGTTVVVAAGNQGLDLDADHSAYYAYCDTPDAICVSATGPTASGGVDGPFTDVDAPAPYSNYGRSVEVAAPGGAVEPVWAACSTFSLIVSVCRTGAFVLGVNGTSMAAPHVTGAAALIVEDVGRKPNRVRARLSQTADDLGRRGNDDFYGKGRINVARAVGAIR
jgi:subtilisin family serine protease